MLYATKTAVRRRKWLTAWRYPEKYAWPEENGRRALAFAGLLLALCPFALAFSLRVPLSRFAPEFLMYRAPAETQLPPETCAATVPEVPAFAPVTTVAETSGTTTAASAATTVTSTAAAFSEAASRAENAPPRYALTAHERRVVEQVVMAESGAEPFAGQMAVAQCILNACEREGLRPDTAVAAYGYTKARPEPTATVAEAVAAVFDRGETVTDEEILYFYNPKMAKSVWHESQRFVVEIAGHRFFGAGR